jgi:hypothetical protein
MQLELLDRTYMDGPDPVTQGILECIAGDRIHQRDREAIITAIRASVRPNGTVSSNDWRPLIPTWVYPKVVGATVSALKKAGNLRHEENEWVISDDVKGRNSGRPTRLYRWSE